MARVARLLGDASSGRQLWYLAGGPGGSAALRCPDQEAADSPAGPLVAPEESDACIASLIAGRDDLDALTGTRSAQDLGALVHADGAVREALVLPAFSYLEFDDWMNTVGLTLLEGCGDDPVCSETLGDDPVGLAAGLRARLEAGHCAALGLVTPVHGLLGYLLYDHGTRELVPPLLHRLARGAQDDVA